MTTKPEGRWVRVIVPEVGDLAQHKAKALDPRKVSRVEGPRIWIDVLGTDVGPLPAAAYEYERWEETK